MTGFDAFTVELALHPTPVPAEMLPILAPLVERLGWQVAEVCPIGYDGHILVRVASKDEAEYARITWYGTGGELLVFVKARHGQVALHGFDPATAATLVQVFTTGGAL